MHIRDARPDDAAAIATIYNHAVEHTTAIWNDVTVDADNRLAWLTERRAAGYPVLVAVTDAADSVAVAGEAERGHTDNGRETVVGYASFGDWRAWDGYRHTVEHSVYVRHDHRGAGIGGRLMSDLIARATGSGKHVMVAGIEAGNTGSIRLHEKLGFTHAGTLHQVGTKFGRWLDLTFLELQLDR